MKLTASIALTFCLVAFTLSAAAQAPASAPASRVGSPPAATSASQPASAPASAPAGAVAFSVGDVKVPVAAVEAQIQGAPPEQKDAARRQVTEEIIKQILTGKYVDDMELPPGELEAWKAKMTSKLAPENKTVDQYLADRKVTMDTIVRQLKIQRMQEAGLAKEKIDAFVKDSPASYFDGTTVRASHILVMCPFYASKVQKEQARAKLEKIQADIKSGQIDFASAARKYSDCPSSKDGGDLGEFKYEKMAPEFSDAAFATPVGQASDIVESSFGFHLIQVNGRIEGSGQAGLDANLLAERILLYRLKMDIYRKALEKYPVTMGQ